MMRLINIEQTAWAQKRAHPTFCEFVQAVLAQFPFNTHAAYDAVIATAPAKGQRVIAQLAA